jgi:hypothetical protein
MSTSVSNPSYEKKRLTQQIENLKIDIQHIIDAKGTEKNVELDVAKKKKKEELNNLTKRLKDLQNQEKQIALRQSEIRHTGHAIDSLEFHQAKRLGSEAVQKAKKEKEMRSEAKEKYFAYLHQEEEYLRLDPVDVPGMLFLHDKVITEYGLCPYIEQSPQVKENRLAWLESTSDQGKIYFDLYIKVFQEDMLNHLKESINISETQIEQLVKSALNKQQYQMYFDALKILQQWLSYTIKTKRLKEQYKTVMHNLSVLYAETKLKIHEYWALKYNTQIIINDMNYNGQVNEYSFQTFDNYMEMYRNQVDELNHNVKYIANTKRNLTNELYFFLTKQKNFETHKQIVQAGKYFKRWGTLTLEEQKERFQSYVDMYVDKFMIKKGLIDESQRTETINLIFDMVHSAFVNKTLVYRDITWNTKRGVIDNIKILRYDAESKKCYIATKPSKKTSKKTSVKTIFSKGNDVVINEDILSYLVRGGRDKNECIESIKAKLKFKRLPADDKSKMNKLFDDMLNVIQEHKN